MNKLVKRFDDIIWDTSSEVEDCIIFAEETKKLAIEFAKWLHRTSWYENEELNTSDKLFDKFIDEYYE